MACTQLINKGCAGALQVVSRPRNNVLSCGTILPESLYSSSPHGSVVRASVIVGYNDLELERERKGPNWAHIIWREGQFACNPMHYICRSAPPEPGKISMIDGVAVVNRSSVTGILGGATGKVRVWFLLLERWVRSAGRMCNFVFWGGFEARQIWKCVFPVSVWVSSVCPSLMIIEL